MLLVLVYPFYVSYVYVVLYGNNVVLKVPTHIWNLAPRRVPQDPEDLIELFTRRSFFQENLEYIQQEISRIDREIERQIAPRFRSNR